MWIYDPSCPRALSHVDSSAAFLLILSAFKVRTILTFRHLRNQPFLPMILRMTQIYWALIHQCIRKCHHKCMLCRLRLTLTVGLYLLRTWDILCMPTMGPTLGHHRLICKVCNHHLSSRRRRTVHHMRRSSRVQQLRPLVALSRQRM